MPRPTNRVCPFTRITRRTLVFVPKLPLIPSVISYPPVTGKGGKRLPVNPRSRAISTSRSHSIDKRSTSGSKLIRRVLCRLNLRNQNKSDPQSVKIKNGLFLALSNASSEIYPAPWVSTACNMSGSNLLIARLNRFPRRRLLKNLSNAAKIKPLLLKPLGIEICIGLDALNNRTIFG